jgi:rhamnogalacturonyl hydrolase YesR
MVFADHRTGKLRRMFWPISTVVSACLMVAMMAYESRLPERLRDKLEYKDGTLDGQFTKPNFNQVLTQTVANLEDLRKLHSVNPGDYSRMEKLLRQGWDQTELNHSHALLAIGIAASHPAPGSAAFEALQTYCRRFVEAGLSKHPKVIDDLMAGYVFLDMYEWTGDQYYGNHAQQMARWLLDTYPRNQMNALPYRIAAKDMMFVDDKGMICGFLIRYGVKFRSSDAIDLAVHQLEVFLEKALNTDGLPFHAYDVSRNRAFGPPTWLRGVGWLTMGISDAIAYLPQTHKSRRQLILAFNRILTTLQQYHEPNGCWRWDLTNPLAETDTSGSAMIGFSVEKAIRSGSLDPKWHSFSESILRCILKHTRANGLVEQALAECNGVGHYGNSFGASNYAQGPALALFSLIRERNHFN